MEHIFCVCVLHKAYTAHGHNTKEIIHIPNNNN